MNFDDFWKAYPKKVGKAYCQKIWARLKPGQYLIHKMLYALNWQRQTEQWQKGSGKFIPNPSTWLNQGRWDDQPVDVGRETPAMKCTYCGKPAVGKYNANRYCMNSQCRYKANGTYEYRKEKGLL